MINGQIIVLSELPNNTVWKIKRVALDGRNNYYFPYYLQLLLLPLHLQLLYKTKLFLFINNQLYCITWN